MNRLDQNDQIFLIGFMGAGKTSVGKALASRLKRPFVDIDTLITNRLKCSVTSIFEGKGEMFFRETETSVLKDVISDGIPSVISTGGGIVLKEDNWALMKSSGKVIYLKADIENIWQRIKTDKSRPLLNVEDPFGEAKRLFESRKYLYEKAEFSVSTDNLDIDEVVNKLQNVLF